MLAKTILTGLLTLVILLGGCRNPSIATPSGLSASRQETATLAGATLNTSEFQLLSYGIGFRAGFNEGSMMVTRIFANMHTDAADDQLFDECTSKLAAPVKQTIADFENTKQESFNKIFADNFRKGVTRGTKTGITYGRELFARVTKLAQSGETPELPNMKAEMQKKTQEAMLEYGRQCGLSSEQATKVVEKLPANF